MPRPQTQKDRAAAQEAARAQIRHREHAAARRRRITVAVVGVVVVAALGLGVFGALVIDSDSATTTTTASTGSSTTTLPAAGNADLPLPAAGIALTGPTECPAEDGSSPRTTSFAGPPPTCIEPGYFYDAELITSKGRLLIQLNPQQAPNAVNNFVVLARYHYYDGQPFTAIFPREAAVVRGSFDNPEGVTSPGYTIPGEAPPEGPFFVPGSIGFVPTSEADDSYGASFLLASFEPYGLPITTTVFGIMLDGQDALVGIDKAGSQQGTPAEVVTIDSIVITRSIAID